MNNFFALMEEYFFIGLFASCLTFVLVSLALKVFPKMGLMDRPHRYGLKRDPIPYYGGVVIYLSFVIGLFVFVPWSSTVMGLLLAGSLIAVTGFLDDFFNISPLIRLFVQFLAGVLLVLFGVGISGFNLPFVGAFEFSMPILSAVFTIFWVMTVINTTNFIDGVGGLSSGVGFVAGMTLFALSVNPLVHVDLFVQKPVAIMSLILAMTCLVFFIFDFPKSQILMGDTGSTFIGFLLATLAIFSGGKVATAFLVLGLPILDLVWVVLRRILSGQKFWKGDLKHLHHRLMDLGLSERRVVMLYVSLTAALGIAAVTFVTSQQKFFIIIGLVTMMVIFGGALVLLPRKNL